MKWIVSLLLIVCFLGSPIHANMWMEPDTTVLESTLSTSPFYKSMEIKDHQLPAWVL